MKVKTMTIERILAAEGSKMHLTINVNVKRDGVTDIVLKRKDAEELMELLQAQLGVQRTNPLDDTIELMKVSKVLPAGKSVWLRTIQLGLERRDIEMSRRNAIDLINKLSKGLKLGLKKVVDKQ